MKSEIFIDGRGNSRTTKDKDATLDYPFDWSGFLIEGDQIIESEVTFSATGSLVVEDFTVVGPIVTAWISGGIVGKKTGVVTCLIKTVQGRIDDSELIFDIKS